MKIFFSWSSQSKYYYYIHLQKKGIILENNYDHKRVTDTRSYLTQSWDYDCWWHNNNWLIYWCLHVLLKLLIIPNENSIKIVKIIYGCKYTTLDRWFNNFCICVFPFTDSRYFANIFTIFSHVFHNKRLHQQPYNILRLFSKTKRVIKISLIYSIEKCGPILSH